MYCNWSIHVAGYTIFPHVVARLPGHTYVGIRSGAAGTVMTAPLF